MGNRFACTACGKCCFGQVPLTIRDALAHVDLFPIALVWTPVRPQSRDFDCMARLGVKLRVSGKQDLAVQIVPTAYIPATLPCPALGDDNLCTIHDAKPLRCKTMPFYPFVDERVQSPFLSPRSGWDCDVSCNAPVVFDNGTILDRANFDAERRELEAQTPLIRQYAAFVRKFTPTLEDDLLRASRGARPGQIVTSLSSFLTGIRHDNGPDVARKQGPVLDRFVQKTADAPDLAGFHKNYTIWAREMAFLAQQ